MNPFLIAAALTITSPQAMVATETAVVTIYAAECTNKDLEGALIEKAGVERVGDATVSDGKTDAHGCWFALKGQIVIVSDDGVPMALDRSEFKKKDPE